MRKANGCLVMKTMPVIGTFYILNSYKHSLDKEKLLSVVWVYTLMISVSLFTICLPSPWDGEWERIPFNNAHSEYLRPRDFLKNIFMIKHPNIYPSGITSLGWIQETLVTRAISHHKSLNKLSFSLPPLICHGAQPSCLKSSTFWQWLQFWDDRAILFHMHHYYF